jgi:hypothetical protein
MQSCEDFCGEKEGKGKKKQNEPTDHLVAKEVLSSSDA